MATISCTALTSLPPGSIVDALTDFGPSRAERWPNLDPKFYETHQLGATWAEVTEGSSFAGGVWERARYDWSTPGVVQIDVLDSNTFAPGGSWTYRIEPVEDGSRVQLRVERRGRTVKGRLLAALVRLTGRLVFCADLRRTLVALERT